jgi:hypothetical protein
MKEPPAPKKGATLKKTGSIHAGYGHVASIRQGDEYPMDSAAEDDGMAEISIHHGPKPKVLSESERNKPRPYKARKTSRVHIPAEEARDLKIGDRVRVSLQKA